MKMALPNRSLSAAPMARNSGAALQQVLNWQLPDVPWHLHFRFRFSVTTYIRVTKREGMRGARKGTRRKDLPIFDHWFTTACLSNAESRALSRVNKDKKETVGQDTPKVCRGRQLL